MNSRKLPLFGRWIPFDLAWRIALVWLGLADGVFAESVNSAGAAELTLADSVARVLQHNPSLAAASHGIHASEARQMQAGLRPNPVLSFEVEDVRVGGGSNERSVSRAWSVGPNSAGAILSRESSSSSGGLLDGSEWTLSVAQVAELGGKRAKRLELAARERDTEAWNYEVVRADVLRDTARTFAEVLAAQERVALQQEFEALAAQVSEAVSQAVEAGRVSPLEAKKAGSEMASAQLAREQGESELASARVGLAALWGEPAAQFGKALGDFREVREPPAFGSLSTRLEENPDVARWASELARHDAAIALERAKAAPDITLSAGIRARASERSSSSGWSFGTDGIERSSTRTRPAGGVDTLVLFGASIPLPLFDRNQGAIREAEHLALRAAQERRSARVRAEAELSQIQQKLGSSYASIQTLRTKIVPEAEGIFRSVKEAYEQGRFGLLEVLDAQRKLIEARERYLDALTEYHARLADAERLIGGSVWSEQKNSAE